MRELGWVADAVERRDMLLRSISDRILAVREADLPAEVQDRFLQPLIELLDDHYRTDFALAHLLEDADLVVGATDPIRQIKTLPSRAVVSLLNRSRTGILRVAGAITDLSGKTPVAFDPVLHSVAPGSVYIGLDAPSARDETLFGVDEPAIEAMQRAMRAIGRVSQLISTDASDETLVASVPDPGLRDAALSAVRDLAPSRQSFFRRVVVGGSMSDGGGSESGPAMLGPDDRKLIDTKADRPLTRESTVELVGFVREIDLDRRRFHLRMVEGLAESISVRGIYYPSTAQHPRDLLARRVRVFGKAELDTEGNPRLVRVERAEIIGEPLDEQPLFDPDAKA